MQALYISAYIATFYISFRQKVKLYVLWFSDDQVISERELRDFYKNFVGIKETELDELAKASFAHMTDVSRSRIGIPYLGHM